MCPICNGPFAYGKADVTRYLLGTELIEGSSKLILFPGYLFEDPDMVAKIVPNIGLCSVLD